MDRKELIEKLNTVIDNLNDEGLTLMDYFVGDMHEVEKYNIKTSPERIAEIKNEEIVRDAAEKEARKKAAFERMQEEEREREKTIASLKGAEKVLYGKIEKVQKLDISKYSLKANDMFFLARLYNNNLFNASYPIFCIGFYQGMRYLKNQARKS